MRKILAIILLSLTVSPAAFAAGGHESALRNFADSKIKSWISNPMVIGAVRMQNDKHAALSQEDIDRMDKQWRAETKAARHPMIDSALGTTISGYLGERKQKGEGLITEIFVTDNKGLNVGQSDVTSDYWQGDEAKWKKTFLVGPDVVFVDDVEFDESTQTYQAQVSMSIADPDTGMAIGSITVGVNVDLLGD